MAKLMTGSEFRMESFLRIPNGKVKIDDAENIDLVFFNFSDQNFADYSGIL